MRSSATADGALEALGPRYFRLMATRYLRPTVAPATAMPIIKKPTTTSAVTPRPAGAAAGAAFAAEGSALAARWAGSPGCGSLLGEDTTVAGAGVIIGLLCSGGRVRRG